MMKFMKPINFREMHKIVYKTMYVSRVSFGMHIPITKQREDSVCIVSGINELLSGIFDKQRSIVHS